MKYATKNNLEFLWEKYDNMLSEWYNALEMFQDMKFKEDDDRFSLFNLIHKFDPSQLTAMKEELERMIEEKESE